MVDTECLFLPKFIIRADSTGGLVVTPTIRGFITPSSAITPGTLKTR